MVETICFYLQNLIFESPKPTTEQGKKRQASKKVRKYLLFFKENKERVYLWKGVHPNSFKKKKSNHQTDMLNNDKENPKKKGGGGHMLEQNFKFLNF